MSALPAKHVFTTEEWHRFAATGAFAADYRAELIEGEIIDMSPVGVDHSACVNYLNRYFNKKLSDDIWVSVQNPITLGDFSEPEPDLLIVPYRDDFYRHAHPSAEDVLLLIEVADSSLAQDRNVKAPLYARFAIAEYWIINLSEKCVELYRKPQQGIYQEKLVLRDKDSLQALNFPNIELTVNQVVW